MFFDKHLGINTEVLHILSANWRCQRERDWLKGKKRRREETKTFRVLRGRSDSRLLIFFPRFSLFFPSEVTVTSSNAIESICRSSHLIHLPSILPSPQFLLSDLRIFFSLPICYAEITLSYLTFCSFPELTTYICIGKNIASSWRQSSTVQSSLVP